MHPQFPGRDPHPARALPVPPRGPVGGARPVPPPAWPQAGGAQAQQGSPQPGWPQRQTGPQPGGLQQGWPHPDARCQRQPGGSQPGWPQPQAHRPRQPRPEQRRPDWRQPQAVAAQPVRREPTLRFQQPKASRQRSVRPPRRRRGGAGAVAALLVLVGLGIVGYGFRDEITHAVAAVGFTNSAGSTGEPMAKSTPLRVRIPSIGVDSSLVSLGLNADQTVQVPPVSQPMQAGWYANGPTPGEKGSAVLLGHVDGANKEGVFYRLREVTAGTEILVPRQDGTTARFVVYKVEQAPKTNFPTQEVYGDNGKPELRVITCGGSFDHSAGSYRDNTIVYAALAP
ncbi:class F sortase [Kutzneria albida]|uniref:class F sortase n=1 Tax=Kutzneria albida TaxID=43357 RepID=UPI0004BA482B